MNWVLILALFALLIAAPFAHFNHASGATFTIIPTSGGVDADIGLKGDGFVASTDGVAWFDSDRDGFRDSFSDSPSEPSFPVTSDQEGAFYTGAMNVPTVAAGTYNVLLDLPQDGIVDGSASFTVVPKMLVDPDSGPPGKAIRILLLGFPASSSGFVWFDKNNNGLRDSGDPSLAATTDDNGFSNLMLTVPITAMGNYKIRADVPAGGSVEASKTFTVTPKIVLNPTKGPPGQVANIQGSGFLASSSGRVWFDTDKDGVKDAGETSVNVVTSSSGTFTAALTVPTVPRGIYPIKAEVPADGAIASADFAVRPKLVLSSSYKNQILIQAVGSGYYASDSGFVYLDTDGDSSKDTGEPSAAVTTSSSGTFTAFLSVQVPEGTYKVRTLKLGSSLSANFVATPHIYSQPNSGPKGTVVTVYGNGFQASVTGFVWFDSDNDNVREKGEPAVTATSTSMGFFKVGLTVPVGVPGSYKIRADVPSGGTVEASRSFSLTL